MRKVLVTEATFKAIDVDTVKNRPELRATTTSDDDPVIAGFIDSATEAYQEHTNNILRLSTWDLYFDEFPAEIETPGPLSSVTSITYYDANGTLQTLSTSYYKVDTTDPIAGRITLKYGQCWPDTYPETNSVIVRIIAGYAEHSIPQRIIDGLVLKIQELHDGVGNSVLYGDCWEQYRRKPI